ncbi:PH domain-containing protein [Enteractinococcus coprophilus]|uniref:Putative membrane protein n=1 Tax=Enteractinococcus coprophilus TaxID=1027633 RepID=A0A543API2_9MICC|nr:PH domain-containing protein [Enteractinococcus coprophilus]TQL74491.1 putative membrane protein [Enteractinococcus coprophilus]
MTQQHLPAPEEHSDDVEPGWRRVHPISPFIRSWSVLLIFVYMIMNFSVQELREVIETFNLTVGQSLLILLGLVVATLTVAAGLYAISWRFYQFRITSDAVQLHSGVIFRRRRYMRLDRLQAVDIVRPFFARIFGLSKLSLHAADGSETTLTLEYVRETEAERLRHEILYLASGAQDDPNLDPTGDSIEPSTQAIGPQLPDYPFADYLGQYVEHNPHGVPEHVATPHTAQPAQDNHAGSRELLTIPFGRVIGAALLTGAATGVWTAIFGGTTTGFFIWLGARNDAEPLAIPLGVLIFLIFLGVALFTAGITAFTQVNANFNFTAKTSSSGVRVTSGMLSTSSHTIPPGRIQAIQITQPLIYRYFGWYRIQVTVAGYGQTDTSTTVLPVGTFDDVITMLSVLAPDPGIEYANDLIFNALKFTADDDGFTRVPSRARIWQPVAGRRHGYTTTPTLLLIRFGRLRRNLAMIPHERLQQSSMYQTLSDKLSGTVSAWFVTPPGPVRTHLRNQEPAALVELFFAEAKIAANARRISDKNQWMAPEELETFEKAAAKAQANGSGA